MRLPDSGQRPPFLVLIDLQKDFYHSSGAYGQAGRPLQPLQETVGYWKKRFREYPYVLRIRSHYKPLQWPDMPGLCANPLGGGRWQPEINRGLLLTKNQQSGFSILERVLPARYPVLLGGVCTHRCIKSTVEDLEGANWPFKVVKKGVGSCGRRQAEHKKCLRDWRKKGLLVQSFPRTGGKLRRGG